jgi:DNA-binding response OmpR family regulator
VNEGVGHHTAPLHSKPVENWGPGPEPQPIESHAGESGIRSALVRVAVIDSDSGFVSVLTRRMGAVGWRHHALASPPPLDRLSAMRVDAVVIDPAVLGADAWSFLGRLCARPGAPVTLVCSGPSTVAQRVRGLRLGVDDWLTKPCHPEEALARLEAALRRRATTSLSVSAQEPVVAGELAIQPNMFEAFVGGRPVGLTRREFELLHLLADAGGRVIPREQIYERVWGYAMAHGDRSVDVFVRRVRKKLENASPAWRYLHTHFGIGYRFEAEQTQSEEPHGRTEPRLPPP